MNVRDKRTREVLLDRDLPPRTVLCETDLGAHQDGGDRYPQGVVRHGHARAHATPEAKRDVLGVEDVGVGHAVLEEPVGSEDVRVGVHLIVVEDRPGVSESRSRQIQGF